MMTIIFEMTTATTEATKISVLIHIRMSLEIFKNILDDYSAGILRTDSNVINGWGSEINNLPNFYLLSNSHFMTIQFTNYLMITS